MRDFVNVGKNRQARAFLDVRKNAQALFQPRPAIGRNRRPVRLVVRRLENQRNAEFARDCADFFRHQHSVRFAFDHAGTGDQEQRCVPAEADLANLKCSRRCHYKLMPPMQTKQTSRERQPFQLGFQDGQDSDRAFESLKIQAVCITLPPLVLLRGFSYCGEAVAPNRDLHAKASPERIDHLFCKVNGRPAVRGIQKNTPVDHGADQHRNAQVAIQIVG